MRMKRNRIQTLNLKNKSVTKDGEGVPVISWSEATQVEVEVWPAGGQLQVQTYGDRINSIMNVKVKGTYTIVPEGNHLSYVYDNFTLREGDGLCIYSDNTPDYRIISIKPYKPLKLEVERI